MMYYHAGPKGLTELRTLRDLINNGDKTIEQAQIEWQTKWHDWIEEKYLLGHPTMDEISLTTDLKEAIEIAQLIHGQVYFVVDPTITRINEEGYPVCEGTVPCQPVEAI